MRRIDRIAEIYKGDVDLEDWIVACLDDQGQVRFLTIFSGPEAEERAFEYAEAKYARVRRRPMQPVEREFGERSWAAA